MIAWKVLYKIDSDAIMRKQEDTGLGILVQPLSDSKTIRITGDDIRWE